MSDHIKYFDPSKDSVVSVSNTSRSSGAVIDLKGHEMFSNRTNFYIWGKEPSGGGSTFYIKHEYVTFNDITQKCAIFVPINDIGHELKVKINCYCKSEMRVAVGMVELSSKVYSEFGRVAINEFTSAHIKSELHMEKGKDFIIILWQVDIGDPIKVLDYFEDGSSKWFNQIKFV